MRISGNWKNNWSSRWAGLDCCAVLACNQVQTMNTIVLHTLFYSALSSFPHENRDYCIAVGRRSDDDEDDEDDNDLCE